MCSFISFPIEDEDDAPDMVLLTVAELLQNDLDMVERIQHTGPSSTEWRPDTIADYAEMCLTPLDIYNMYGHFGDHMDETRPWGQPQ
jgi:hypothetical protein